MREESQINGGDVHSGRTKTAVELKTEHALTPEQRRLVGENIGLIVVHLRRHVFNLAVPRRDREWEDLFQEGCLGLIRAAMSFREERGIPFASYALPRIHNAVSRALQRKFATVYVPPKRARLPTAGSTSGGLREGGVPPRTYSLTEEAAARLADRDRSDPDDAGGETVGQRLRGKYERAVRRAGQALCGKTTARGDRDKLVRILEEERFLVPHDEAKRPLRQIARDTDSSYARVAQCDGQFAEAVRKVLTADPEFIELRRSSRTHPSGTGRPIDDELECRLQRAAAREFVRRLHDPDATDRAGMLDILLEMSPGDIQDIVHARFSDLPSCKREQLLQTLSQTGDQSRLKDRSPAQRATRREGLSDASEPLKSL